MTLKLILIALSHMWLFALFLASNRHDLTGSVGAALRRSFSVLPAAGVVRACCNVAALRLGGVRASSDSECSVQSLPSCSGGKELEGKRAGAI